jgi:hypothetical protein
VDPLNCLKGVLAFLVPAYRPSSEHVSPGNSSFAMCCRRALLYVSPDSLRMYCIEFQHKKSRGEYGTSRREMARSPLSGDALY